MKVNTLDLYAGCHTVYCCLLRIQFPGSYRGTATAAKTYSHRTRRLHNQNLRSADLGPGSKDLNLTNLSVAANIDSSPHRIFLTSVLLL